MTDSWATFGADLHLETTGAAGLRTGLKDALREAVRTGRLAPGTRLPSSRSLAVDLGIARNTVADAYAELVAEGWLTARQGSGTRVAQRAEPRTVATRAARSRPVRARPAHNLLPGSPDLSTFPRADWLKASRRALTAAPNDAFGYGDPRGRIELRTVLADYLARARGVYADPERIVVCAGFVQALQLMGAGRRAACRTRTPGGQRAVGAAGGRLAGAGTGGDLALPAPGGGAWAGRAGHRVRDADRQRLGGRAGRAGPRPTGSWPTETISYARLVSPLPVRTDSPLI